MMDSAKVYTEEATETLQTYLRDVRQALSDTDLSKEEIDQSLEELENHIFSYCEIKATGKVISTDLVNGSIKKLGNPKSIAETLQHELDFKDTLGQSNQVVSSPIEAAESNQIDDESYKIRAFHISRLFETLSWLLTSIVLFISFGYTWLVEVFPYLYALTVIFMIYIRDMRIFSINNHLQKTIKPNFHIMVIPIIFILSIFGPVRIFMSFDQGIQSVFWTIPAVLTIWLVIISREIGQQYFRTLYQQLKHIRNAYMTQQ